MLANIETSDLILSLRELDICWTTKSALATPMKIIPPFVFAKVMALIIRFSMLVESLWNKVVSFDNFI